jgi:uncharacterized protein
MRVSLNDEWVRVRTGSVSDQPGRCQQAGRLRSQFFAECDRVAGRFIESLTMFVKGLWRYPVKSMAGESLEAAELSENGVAGDRIVQVRNPKGRILSSRTKPGLLRHHAALDADGNPLVDGRPWQSADVAHEVEEAAGPGTHLVRSDAEDRFDVLPLLIATDGMLETVGYDSRRFRPNVVIGGVPGLGEREWEGERLRIGDAVIEMEKLRLRCIMTTFDPDTGVQDVGVLNRIREEFGGVLGLNAGVVKPGRIHLGDRVELVHG